LLCIAAAVSVAAILTIAGIGAVFAGQRHEVAGKTAETSSAQGGQREGAQGRAFVFSFGLEHVSHLNPDGPAKDGNATGTR
jgi:hypothetical protein